MKRFEIPMVLQVAAKDALEAHTAAVDFQDAVSSDHSLPRKRDDTEPERLTIGEVPRLDQTDRIEVRIREVG
jgi:hypothetical protein